MKKTLLVIAFAAIAAFSANAQSDFTESVKSAYKKSSPRAIGVRLGYGISFSYQQGLGSGNVLSIDADLPAFNGLGIAITHDWMNPFGAKIPWNKKGEWNWYLGAGLNGGFAFGSRVQNNDLVTNSSAGWIGVAGRAGVEYNFEFPLQLAAEWRPTFGPSFSNSKTTLNGDVINKTSVTSFFSGGLYASAIAVCVRYRF